MRKNIIRLGVSFWIIILSAVFGFCGIAFSNSFTLPDGWRYPSEKDYIYDWKSYANSDSKPFRCKGDYNGDGLIDEAYILFKKQGSGGGLFVFLSRGDKPALIQNLDMIDEPVQRRGIETIKPGEYATGCGKGYWPCAKGEPSKIKSSTDSISFFIFESANSIFYWDVNTKKFKRVWMTD